MNNLEKRNPHWSLSTYSGVPLNANIFSPEKTTLHVVAQVVLWKEKLPLESQATASVSLSPGKAIDVNLLKKEFDNKNIPVTTIDLPDIHTMGSLVWDEGKNLLEFMTRQKNREAFLIRAKNCIGWNRLNVGSERKNDRRLEQSLQLFQSGLVGIRSKITCIKELLHSERRTNTFIEMIRKYEVKYIALEIDADSQTPREFLKEFMDIREDFRIKYSFLDIGIDVDPAHMIRAKDTKANKGKDVQNPAEEFRILLEESAGAVRMVSLNEHTGGEETHALVTNGGLAQLPEIVGLYGQAEKEGRLDKRFVPLFIIESHPRHIATMVGEDGRRFYRNMQDTFFAK